MLLLLKCYEDIFTFRKQFLKKLYDLLQYNSFEHGSLIKINNISVTFSFEVKSALIKNIESCRNHNTEIIRKKPS